MHRGAEQQRLWAGEARRPLGEAQWPSFRLADPESTGCEAEWEGVAAAIARDFPRSVLVAAGKGEGAQAAGPSAGTGPGGAAVAAGSYPCSTDTPSQSRGNAENRVAGLGVYAYPDGSFSGVAYTMRGRKRENPSVPSWWAGLSDQEKADLNRERVGRRAAQRVRHLVRTGNLTRLLTFTNGGDGDGWPSTREAMLSLGRWYRREGRALLGDTGIVTVAERGKKARIHLHAAIRAGYRLDYGAIIRSWSAHLESEGYRSTSTYHRFHAGDDTGRHSEGFSSARICARYLAKYLSKSFSDERIAQERRHWSEDITPLEPERILGLRLGEIPGLLADTFPGCSVVAYTDGEGLLAGYFFDTT